MDCETVAVKWSERPFETIIYALFMQWHHLKNPGESQKFVEKSSAINFVKMKELHAIKKM